MVAIVLGSRSDRELANHLTEVLEKLGVPYELRILSAHRTPQEAAAFASAAAANGFRVLIGIAGMAAALPGILAAHTALPVIGVAAAAGALAGVDALLSIAQMPPGVPVAAVGIGAAAARNAGLLACRILALSDRLLAERLDTYIRDLRKDVLAADGELRRTWRPSEG